MGDADELHGLQALALDAGTPSMQTQSEGERERDCARIWSPQRQPPSPEMQLLPMPAAALRNALPPFAAQELASPLPALLAQLAEAHAHETAAGDAAVAAALHLQQQQLQQQQQPLALQDALAFVKRLLGV